MQSVQNGVTMGMLISSTGYGGTMTALTDEDAYQMVRVRGDSKSGMHVVSRARYLHPCRYDPAALAVAAHLRDLTGVLR